MAPSRLAILCTLIGAAGAASTTANAKNVFGKDDRVAMKGKGYPWSAIGRIDLDNNWCMATLIGDDLILTAAHCLIDEAGNRRPDLEFMPNYRADEYKDKAKLTEIWVGSHHPLDDVEQDWAIALISKPLGRAFGTIAVATIDASQPKRTRASVTLAGYSMDFRYGKTAGVHENCEFTGVRGARLMHDCDSRPGASGAPLLMGVGKNGGLRVVAIDTAELFEDAATRRLPKPGTAYSDARKAKR